MKQCRIPLLFAFALAGGASAIELSSSPQLDERTLPKALALIGQMPNNVFDAFGAPSKIWDACSAEPGCVGFGYGAFDVFYNASGVYRVKITSPSIAISGVSVGDSKGAAMKKWGTQEVLKFTSGSKYFETSDDRYNYTAGLNDAEDKVEFIQIEKADLKLDAEVARKLVSMLDESGARAFATVGYPRKIADLCSGDDNRCVDLDYGSADLFLNHNKIYRVMIWRKDVDFNGVRVGMDYKSALRAWDDPEVNSFKSGVKFIKYKQGQVIYAAVFDKEATKVSYFQIELAN